MNYFRRWAFLSLVAGSLGLALLVFGPAAIGQPGAAAPAQPFGASQPIPQRYIVVFQGDVADPGAEARNLMRGRGGEIHYTYRHAIKGFAATIPDAAYQEVRMNPRVTYLEQDHNVSLSATQSNATWGLDRIDQRELPLDGLYEYGTTAPDVFAFIIDTGIRADHVDFSGRVQAGATAIEDGRGTADCNGHGTHVAGTVGGTTWGAAKAVQLVPVRVLDCNGAGTMSGVIAGVDWVAGQTAQRPAVANLSLGGGAAQSLDDAVENAIKKGVTMVVAAGNANADACNYSPARAPNAITVAASTSSDSRSSFSNYGSCVDLFAPGASIRSAYHTSNTATALMSGTSMAAPHVAGVAALVLQADPAALPGKVRNVIVDGATQGIVTSSLTANHHLLYSRVTLGEVVPPEPDGVAPEIVKFTVSDGSGGPWTRADVIWTVTDDVSLATVLLELLNGTSVVTRESIIVSGTTASGSTSLRTRGAADAVRIVVSDAAGNVTNDTQSMSSEVLPPENGGTEPEDPVGDGFTLSGQGYKVKGFWTADLVWSGSTADDIDVFREGVPIATVKNNGGYTDNTNFKGGGSLTYQVCEAGTDACSKPITIAF